MCSRPSRTLPIDQPVILTDVTPYDTSAVPEPSTVAFVALGVGGILYRLRRR
ncbi:PEP-CTERM sorting domain-containing protein [Bryobacter aggregatus]|uniref:PEP-CTERM sorting domain-containing protein n=1 Tax=Bryobacter aggregatus TaxID=360054 RepID=UPI00138E5538